MSLCCGADPVHIAADVGAAAVVERLVAAGHSPKATGRGGVRATHLAARGGHAAALKALVRAGCDADAAAKDGRRPVHLAAAAGHAAALKVLAVAGCDLTAADAVGRTPALLAFQNRRVEALKVLMRETAPDKGDVLVRCIPNYAAEVLSFVGKGASVEDDRTRALAVNCAAEMGHLVALDLFMKAGCVLNPADRSVHVPICKAAKHGHTAVLEYLVKAAGCSVDVLDFCGKTPAFLAAEKGHAAALEFLIKAGCDLNVADDDGWTAAHVAAAFGHVLALELLIKAGCDVNVADDEGSTPLTEAFRCAQPKCFRLLTLAGADHGPMAPFRASKGSEAEKLLDLSGRVRRAGSWRSYVTEERRSLATLRALWRRGRIPGSPTSARKVPRRDSTETLPYQPVSGDAALLERVFALPKEAAGRVLSFYTDLVLTAL